MMNKMVMDILCPSCEQITLGANEFIPDRVTKYFYLNKLLLEEIMEGGNKLLRNRIAGYMVNIKNKEGKFIRPLYKGVKDIRKRRREQRKRQKP